MCLRIRICETITGDANNPVFKSYHQGPQDTQQERAVSNQVGYPRDKLYHHLLQDWLPGNQEMPGQGKSELFTKFHRPGLRPEGNT